ncbi:MAG: FAD-dependent oxidoreductase [Kiritimatiellae bacterium]|nr:FAD-dependent oxidoreductase [Kiritimatiellia bacterium]
MRAAIAHRALPPRLFAVDAALAVRVMPPAMAMGQAAGTAAALCARTGVLPRR